MLACALVINDVLVKAGSWLNQTCEIRSERMVSDLFENVDVKGHVILVQSGEKVELHDHVNSARTKVHHSLSLPPRG